MEQPVPGNPLAPRVMWRFGIHPEVWLDKDSLVFDQLVVVDPGHPRRVRRATQIVRTEELKSAARLVSREEQSPSLVDVDDPFSLDAIGSRDAHGPSRVLLAIRTSMAGSRDDGDYQF